MSRYPHTKLFYHPRHVVVLSGPHVQVVDIHGRILYSTSKFTQENGEAVIKSGPIRCSGMSEDGRYLVTTGDDKRLKIWDLNSLSLLSERALPKKPTAIEFLKNMDILVSDKFGDVFRYAFHPNSMQVEEKRVLDAHENGSGGALVLGHASLLTSFSLTPDERFIITADRDEHIRISWYPEGYNIESYCLGHTKYVSAIHIPTTSPQSLISGGGDPELKVWDWMTGHLLRDITILAAVEPFIKVKGRSRRREFPGENEDNEEVDKSKDGTENLGEENTTATVLVVRRINSFLSKGETHIVFNMVGATAIFEFMLSETDDLPDIRCHDFGKPVVDFTVGEEGLIWVLLDADFSEGYDVTNDRPRKLIQTIQWSVNQFTDASSSALLESLNTICSVSATVEDLKALDLYSDLSSLPKRIDGEQGRCQSTRDPLEDEPAGGDTSAAVGLTKRALGRLKHKRALNQLQREKAGVCDMSGPSTKKMKAVEDSDDLYSM